MEISNRRYIGCKTKLLDFIYNTIMEYNIKPNAVFADIFAGTGVVANYFAEKQFNTILNDTLYSNVVAYYAWLGEGQLDVNKLNNYLKLFNSLSPDNIENNYFSDVYGGKYYSLEDAKIIGYIRDYIENNKNDLSYREYCYLITSLIYAADKIANTVGHFESFLSKPPQTKGVRLSPLNIHSNISPAQIFNEDANDLVRKISCNIAYIDPPYNARQYVNFYHVLENLARWNKPVQFEGNSMKFPRKELKSNYCRSKAPELMDDLVQHIDADLIVVSYNNTYKAGSISSVNTIMPEQLVDILSRRGNVVVKEMDYRAFNSGKTELNGHKELLYVCEVKK